MRIIYDDAVNGTPNVEGTLVSLEALCRGIEKGNIKNVRVLSDDAEAEAVRSWKIADDHADIEITLRPSVYAELLFHLDRLADNQYYDADRDWLRQFARCLRIRQSQGLH